MIAVPLLLIFGARVDGVSLPDTSRSVRFDSSVVSLRPVPRQNLNEYLADKNFLYDREPPAAVTLWQQLKVWIAEKIARWLFAPGRGVYWRTVAYIFVAVVLFFVAAKLLKTDVRGLLYQTGGRRPGNSGAAAEDIHAIDFATEIDAAIRQERYRLALRLSYLALLKKLTEQGLLDWKIDKTNRAYLEELKKSDLRPAFAEIISLFEHIWYGEFAVDKIFFQRALETFQNFGSRLAEVKS